MPSGPVAMVLGGSLGDIQPFLYLAEALIERGRSVRLCTDPMYQQMVEASGAEFVALASTDPRQIARDTYALRKRLGRAYFLRRFLVAAEPDANYLARMVSACTGAGALLCNGVVGFATHIGQKLNVPTGIVLFAPFHPTRAFPVPIGPQDVALPGTGNLLTHLLLHEMYWLPNAPWINRWRVESLGLPALNRWWPPQDSSVHRFFAFSASLLPSIRDWPKNLAICFGSVMDERVLPVARQVVEAARELGLRIVVVGGWGIEKLEASPDVFFTPFVPYSWLFARVQAVVHAAGCGTSAEVLRAGVPCVTVPFAGEQKFWAHRLWQSGASARPLDWKTVSKDAVLKALIAVRENQAMRQTAASLGAQLQAENGVQRTIDLLLKG